MAKQKKAANMGFSEAVTEVEDILRRLESDEIDIDELTAEVRRSVELIAVCREKLDRAEVEVRDFVAGLRDDQAAAEAPAEAAAGGAAADTPDRPADVETDDEKELPF